MDLCRALVTEIYYLLADYYFKNKEMTYVSTFYEFTVSVAKNY